MNSKVVPGQMGQPPKDDLQDMGYDSLGTPVQTTHPQIDYYMAQHGNPLQDTSPFVYKVQNSNESQGGSMRTANDINGGGDMFRETNDVVEAP